MTAVSAEETTGTPVGKYAVENAHTNEVAAVENVGLDVGDVRWRILGSRYNSIRIGRLRRSSN